MNRRKFLIRAAAGAAGLGLAAFGMNCDRGQKPEQKLEERVESSPIAKFPVREARLFGKEDILCVLRRTDIPSDMFSKIYCLRVSDKNLGYADLEKRVFYNLGENEEIVRDIRAWNCADYGAVLVSPYQNRFLISALNSKGKFVRMDLKDRLIEQEKLLYPAVFPGEYKAQAGIYAGDKFIPKEAFENPEALSRVVRADENTVRSLRAKYLNNSGRAIDSALKILKKRYGSGSYMVFDAAVKNGKIQAVYGINKDVRYLEGKE